MSNTMRLWRLPQFGRQHLQLEQVDIPTPADDEILVKVAAAALNYRDKLNIEDGSGGLQITPPLVPASDLSGAVVAVGKRVKRFRTGDRVLGTFWADWIDGPWPAHALTLGGPLTGALAEYVVLKQEWAVHAPATLDDVHASTLPCAALSAWFALVEQGHLHAGQTVVIQGTGGVSLFGLQFAAAHGANVIVLSGDDDKLARAKELGATHAINRRKTPRWDVAVRDLTAGRGADHVLEMVGGDNLLLSLQALKQAGRVSVIGMLGDAEIHSPSVPLFLGRPTIQGIGVGHRRALEDMIRAVDHLGLKPVVDQVYALEELPAALDHLERGPFGKLVVRMD